MIKGSIIINSKGIGLDKHPKLFLKLNYEFKKLGFKRVSYREELTKTTYHKELCLMIRPRISGFMTDIYNIPDEIYQVIRKLKGFDSSSYYKLRGEEIKIETNVEYTVDNQKKTRKLLIGCYLKDRNTVLLYPAIFYNVNSGLDNEIIPFFVEGLKDWIKSNKLVKVDVKEKIKQAMVLEFINDANERINTIKGNISESERNIENYSRYLVESHRSIIANQEVIKALTELRKNIHLSLMKQIEEIKKLDFVKKCELTTQGIKIDVGLIKIRYLEKDVEIGEFTIILNPKQITFENRTKPVGEYQHPHIHDNACLGDRRTKAYELLGKYELKKLVHFLYLYLKSYTQGDSYKSIEHWMDDYKEKDEDEENNEGRGYV